MTTVEFYDLEADAWSYAMPLREARGGLGAAVLGGKIYALGGEVLTLHVLEPLEAVAGNQPGLAAGSPPGSVATTSLEDERLRQLQQIIPTDPTVKWEYRMLVGSPAEAIVSLVRDEDVDLIVMSTHGRTGLRRLLMGSVAEAVVRKAPCPVLTMRNCD